MLVKTRVKKIYQYIKKGVYNTMRHSDRFISLPSETLLLTTRGHWFMLAPPFLLTTIAASFFTLSIISIFLFLLPLLSLLILFLLLITTISFSLISHILVAWYYHVYIVTTHKIIEITYIPLSHHLINEVLLNQVRCTEIDVKTKGIINEILNKGDVIITFDRPTHQEEFVLSNIAKPSQTAIFLSDNLINIRREVTSPVWYQTKDKPSKFRFTDDLNPNVQFFPI